MVQAGPTGGGTVLNQNLKLVNTQQQNSYGSSTRARGRGTSSRARSRRARHDALGQPLFRLYAPAYQPAIDAQGNADCQNGQNGYPNGGLSDGRYRPGNLARPLERGGPADPGRGRHRRERRDHRQQPAGPVGRHLQVARARHRQPGGRAVTNFRAGLLAIVVVGLGAFFGFTKTNPFADPYEFGRSSTT